MRDRNALRGAAVVAVVFSSTAIMVGSAQYAFALFIEPLESAFGWSRAQISASLSFTAVGSLLSPVLGRLMDRHGARPILVGSLTLAGASFLVRPLMSELWHWYAVSFLQFVAFSGATVLPAGRLVGLWFPHIRGRVLGIAAMGNNFGGLVVPPAVAGLLAYASWRAGFLAIGVATIAMAAVALAVVREPPAARPSGGRSGARGAAPPAAMPGVTPREAMRTRAFWAIAAAITLGTFTYSTVLPHVLAHLVSRGMSIGAASFALSTLALGGIVGKLAFGALAERAGSRAAAIANLSGQAAFALALAGLEEHSALGVAVPLFGFFMGGFGVLLSLLVQDAFGLRHFGAVMGLMNVGTVVSFGLGPPLAGVAFDLAGSYAPAFVAAAVLFVAAAATLAVAGRAPRFA